MCGEDFDLTLEEAITQMQRKKQRSLDLKLNSLISLLVTNLANICTSVIAYLFF